MLQKTSLPRHLSSVYTLIGRRSAESSSAREYLLNIIRRVGFAVSVFAAFFIAASPPNTFAQSACIGNYSTNSSGQIQYFNPVSNSLVTLATFSSSDINGVSVQPSTGNIYFVDRFSNRLVFLDPTTNNFTTLPGTLPSGGSLGQPLGASFTNTGLLYVMYELFGLIQVNPATGTQIGGTITITGIPGDGFQPPGTNGDIVVDASGQMWIAGNTSAGVSRLYTLNISGSTATATAFSPNISGVSGSVNGISIDPQSGTFYASTNSGIYQLNQFTGVATLRASGSLNDLGSCPINLAAPTISKSFSPNSAVSAPATITLTITIGNTNLTENFLTADLVDSLPSGMVVATPNGLGGTCRTVSGNVVTATAGSATITFSSGGKIPTGGCTIIANVTTASSGTFVNTIAAGALQTLAGNNADPATDTFTVASATDLEIEKAQRLIGGSFQTTALNVPQGDDLQYRLVITNSGSGTVTSATFSDSVPANITGLTVVSATPQNGATACTATFGVSPNQNDLSGIFSGPNSAICEVVIRGTATTDGNVVNQATVTPPTGISDPDCSGSPTVCNGNNVSSVTTNIIAPPNVTLTKNCTVPADCSSAPQLPDTELTYQIDFANIGGASASGLILVDNIPNDTDYKLGSATANAGTTGLIFVVEYSDDYDSGNPAIATWNYTPVSEGGGAPSGFDRNVRAVRWRVTAGNLSQTSPNNSGSVSFISKIR